VGSAVNDVARELGSALGIAVLGSLFNTGYANAVSDATDALPPEAAHAAQGSAGAAFAMTSQLGAGGQEFAAAVRDAFASGLNDALTAGAILAVLAAVFTLARAPRRNRLFGDGDSTVGVQHASPNATEAAELAA
jgi:hypothetical protein